MRRWIIPLLCLFLALSACPSVKGGGTPTSSPQPKASPSPSQKAGPAKSPSAEEPFDPNSITKEMKAEAFIDITALIKELNRITQARDYDSWKTYLAEAFIAKYSDPEFLLKLSEAPILKQQGIVLKTLRDYFDFVVYPSHQNDRVDDIEFIGHNRVKAITISKKKESLVLWDLEKIGNSWKIGIGR
jgi:hypothetical protein